MGIENSRLGGFDAMLSTSLRYAARMSSAPLPGIGVASFAFTGGVDESRSLPNVSQFTCRVEAGISRRGIAPETGVFS